MKILVFVLATLVMVLISAPATLVDRGISELSGGGVRVGSASGSIWKGHGIINVIDAGTQGLRPWYRIAWELDPIGLFRGGLSWRIITDSVAASGLTLRVSGWGITGFRISGPAQYFLQRIPGGAASLGWDGDITLEVGRFECNWGNRCSGKASANWVSAGTSFLPGQVFGDYQVTARAENGAYEFDWSSSNASVVKLSGKGQVSDSGELRLTGIVKGDPMLLSHLPAVAGPWVRPTQAADSWKIVFP